MTTLCIQDLSNVVAFDRSRLSRKPMTDDQMIIAAVDRALVGKVSNTKVCQARVRAMDNFHGGVQMDMAIRRAVSWARCTTDEGNSPKDAA
jgi:hypothetical protein